MSTPELCCFVFLVHFLRRTLLVRLPSIEHRRADCTDFGVIIQLGAQVHYISEHASLGECVL
ncbi:MAG: hypothetical protein OXJ38_01355, partial [Gammaproteobacteria bacterium]|nr:hypothetical protein [Gammaproteobacteria bacterium]